MDVSVLPLAEGDWGVARGLMHRAFVDEAFTVEMYGEQLLDRWGGSWGLYCDVVDADYTLALGARLGDVLVGVVAGSVPGRCHLCQVSAGQARPEDPHLAVDWDFRQNVAHAHSALGAHAWVSKAAVEPALHGLGIGRKLLESAAEALRDETPTELVLECAPGRVGFYTALGYEQVATISDPTGPDASLMRRWVR